MHRSGTSLVAKIFYEVGADLGPKETLYPGDRWNPDGYYEQPAIHSINMTLIHGPFWKFSYFFLPNNHAILRRAEKLAARIHAAALEYENRLVKETRFCLTLPTWRAHGASVSGILVCLRNPEEVVASIRRRLPISESLGYKLWETHLTRLLENSKDIPLRFVYCNNLLKENLFLKEISGALRFFGLRPEERSLMSFWKKNIENKKISRPTGGQLYPASVEFLWRELLGRHERQSA